jgi:hypothetical protein
MGQPFEFIPLAAGKDGHRDLMQLGGGKHEIDMIRRLFQGLEKGIEGLGGQHMHLVDQDDLEARIGGHEPNFFLQFTDFLNTAIGGAIHFLEVDAGAVGNLPAGSAYIAGFGCRPLLAVERLGHDSGERGFAGSANAAENQRMGNAILGKCVLQSTNDRLLADDLGKSLGTGFSGKDEVGHSGYRRSMIRRDGVMNQQAQRGAITKKDSQAPLRT